jgi:hypothetical protein
MIYGALAVVVVVLSVWIGYRWGYVEGMKAARLIISDTFKTQRNMEQRARYV